jgi:hypothetical protein
MNSNISGIGSERFLPASGVFCARMTSGEHAFLARVQPKIKRQVNAWLPEPLEGKECLRDFK